MNSNGDTTWTRLYDGSNNKEAGGIYQTSDGGYIFNGTTSSIRSLEMLN